MAIRLSEAMRLGAMMDKQHFGDYFLRARSGEVLASCALGAASRGGFTYDPIRILQKQVACPVCGIEARTLRSIIVHLNDHHRWTREQIADWVEIQEQLVTVDIDSGEQSPAFQLSCSC